jgi:hypothetical protein
VTQSFEIDFCPSGCSHHELIDRPGNGSILAHQVKAQALDLCAIANDQCIEQELIEPDSLEFRTDDSFEIEQ